MVRTTIGAAEAALSNARQAEDSNLRSPLEPLRFQRQILENLRLLETIHQELSTARLELASLARLPLSQDFDVVEPADKVNTRWLHQPLERMEEYALLRNPDLREGMYNVRIAQQETRRTLLRLFPGLSFNAAYRHSDDSYLINRNWSEAGAQLSFNLLGLLSAPAQMRLAEAGVALAQQRRMAIQMTVLTQLHIARLQYANAARQFERADAIARVDGRITQHIINQEQALKQPQAERVAQQTSYVLSQLRRYQALSNAQSTASRLQATLGLEPAIAPGAAMPLASLAAEVARALKGWDEGTLPDVQQANAEVAQ